mmetsp:Transcript_11287/g.27758  ORF Transcript_11287/g.27758 Transcript_11287/m.27758 type:complete len:213 (-) Transcript_11287:308-946(-)
MTDAQALAAARVVGDEFAADRSSLSTDTTWQSTSRSRTDTSPRRTVRCRAEQREERVDWNSASRYVASSERIWDARADAAECEDEDDPVLLYCVDVVCSPPSSPSLLSLPPFSSSLSTSSPPPPSSSTCASCDSAPFALFLGCLLFSGSPKKSRYSAVSTVHSLMRNTDASLVMPTSPCRSLSASMCPRTVDARSASLAPQYVFRHNARRSS